MSAGFAEVLHRQEAELKTLLTLDRVNLSAFLNEFLPVPQAARPVGVGRASSRA